jgi:hypothetical protein
MIVKYFYGNLIDSKIIVDLIYCKLLLFNYNDYIFFSLAVFSPGLLNEELSVFNLLRLDTLPDEKIYLID